MANIDQKKSAISELFESNKEARGDMQALLKISNRDRLIETLASDPDLIAAPDPSREQINALAGAAGLGQEEFWSAIRIIDWLCRNNEEIEVDFLAANLEEAGLLRKTETENWRKFFLEAMVAVPPAYLRRSTISGIMTTFRSVEYACDLRLDPDDRTLPPIPVCVVRIQNDEGEPLIFQCAPVDLDRLIEVLRDARGIFSQTISKES